jgi:2-iminobutanoate/2-iminopropanoate deaminase
VTATDKTAINPWTWQDARGFTQAWRVRGAESMLYLSGQGPVDADGRVVATGDFDAQARQTFANLATVLHQAGYDFPDIVKLTVYLTDIGMLPGYGRIKAEYIHGPQPASTAIEVTALALPGMQLEVDAIAVR